MSIYVSKDNTVVKAYPRYNNNPILFGYLNNGSEMKKFYDIAEAIDYIEFEVSNLFLDKTTANFTNANESTIVGLSGYGSFSIGTNYVQINSYKTSSSIWLLINAYVHFKVTSAVYALETYWGANKRFVDSILAYAISLTGYCQYRTSSSTSSSGYIQNRVFGNIMLGTESCSTTSTVTKTLGNANTWPLYYAFAYIGAGRSSGSQNIISKLTFNSCTFNGVSIPMKLTNNIFVDRYLLLSGTVQKFSYVLNNSNGTYTAGVGFRVSNAYYHPAFNYSIAAAKSAGYTKIIYYIYSQNGKYADFGSVTTATSTSYAWSCRIIKQLSVGWNSIEISLSSYSGGYPSCCLCNGSDGVQNDTQTLKDMYFE